MCGQVGIIFGKKRRRITERSFLTNYLSACCSAVRSASTCQWHGTAKTDGDYGLFKRPIRAHRLIKESAFTI